MCFIHKWTLTACIYWHLLSTSSIGSNITGTAHRVLCYICITQTGEWRYGGWWDDRSMDAVIPRAMCARRVCLLFVIKRFLVNYDRGLCIVRSHGGKVAIVGAITFVGCSLFSDRQLWWFIERCQQEVYVSVCGTRKQLLVAHQRGPDVCLCLGRTTFFPVGRAMASLLMKCLQ